MEYKAIVKQVKKLEADKEKALSKVKVQITALDQKKATLNKQVRDISKSFDDKINSLKKAIKEYDRLMSLANDKLDSATKSSKEPKVESTNTKESVNTNEQTNQ